MTSLVVPTERLRQRLHAQTENTTIELWRPGFPSPTGAQIDLLVLPYMMDAPQLRHLRDIPVSLVQSQTLGFDGVKEYLPPGIRYCNAVDVHERSTAELAVALMLAALRGVPDAVRNADRGAWEHRRWPGLAGKRVLVLGAGGVGSEIARYLAPFDVRVDVAARTRRERVRSIEELPELLPRADVVVIAMPLRDETKHFVGSSFLGAMRSGALLVNIARGEIVDTDALVAELQQGRIQAALDVTSPEPLPADHPLWSFPNVIITPHVGGDTDAMDERIDRVILEQLRRVRSGEPPLNLVLGHGAD